MKFFVTEAERRASGSSCFFEFQKGKYRGKCWLPDSLSIRMELFDELKLYDLISSAVPSFDNYGLTEIDREDWSKIVEQSHLAGGKAEEAICEANSWASACFLEVPVITICGI